MDRTTPFEEAMSRYLFALERLHTEADQSDEMSGLLTDALSRAEDAVMSKPAQGIADLRAKADILFCDADSLPKDQHILAFFTDLIRLTGDTPSRVFDPERWLAWFQRCGGNWTVQNGKAWLMWPETDSIKDCMTELAMRGGKAAVMDLIRTRHDTKEA